MRCASILLGFALVAVSDLAAAPDPTPLNAAVVKFCASKEGKRVGTGECNQLAIEALRVAGAEFTRVGPDGKAIPDSPSDGDYVWGTLVKTYSYDEKGKKIVDSAPKAKCRPGDILQLNGVKLADGFSYVHHTAVVSMVDAAGNPAGVYQQNIKPSEGGDARVVRKFTLKSQDLKAGRILIYRPDPPTNPSTFHFTWTNNSKSDTVEFTYYGKPDKLGAPNSADGYRYVWGYRGADQITVGGKDYTLTTRKAYEFYTTKDGKIALREIE